MVDLMVGHPGRVGFIASPSLVPRYVSQHELEMSTLHTLHYGLGARGHGQDHVWLYRFGRILRLHGSTLHCHSVNECDCETVRTHVDCLLTFES